MNLIEIDNMTTASYDDLPEGHDWREEITDGRFLYVICAKCLQAMMFVDEISKKDVESLSTFQNYEGPLHNVWARYGWKGNYDFDALIPDNCEEIYNQLVMKEALE